jgi:DNA-binding transcriptional LysR family regulator
MLSSDASMSSAKRFVVNAPTCNLDVALLRTFVATVDLGSVARAAERVGRSQPAASLQLKRLEEITGAPIFRKNGRGLALTESGDVLLGYARRLLELNDETVSAVTTMRLSGTVRLGVMQDFSDDWLTKVLVRFTRAHPTVVVEVKSDRSAVLNDAIARKQLDFIVTFGVGETPGAIELGRIPMNWIGAKDMLWRESPSVPLVLFDPPCEFRQVAVAALENAGTPWRLAFSSPSLSSQWSAVEAGLGVTLRTPIGLRPQLRTLGKVDGLPALPRSDLRVVLRSSQKRRDPSMLRLQEILVETIREKMQTELRSSAF